MKTTFDIISVVLFAGLAILYLQRSAAAEPDPIPLWRYAVAAIGCAVADILGNNGYDLPAYAFFAFVVIFTIAMLKPFQQTPKP